MFMTLSNIDLCFVFLWYASLGWNQGSISLIYVVGKCSFYFLLEEILKNWYYFFKNLVEFFSEAIWAWAFLCGKIFNYYINFFIWYMFNQIFYFFFGQFLVICVFLETFPFHLCCPIFVIKFFRIFSYYHFNFYSVNRDISSFNLDFGNFYLLYFIHCPSSLWLVNSFEHFKKPTSGLIDVLYQFSSYFINFYSIFNNFFFQLVLSLIGSFLCVFFNLWSGSLGYWLEVFLLLWYRH